MSAYKHFGYARNVTVKLHETADMIRSLTRETSLKRIQAVLMDDTIHLLANCDREESEGRNFANRIIPRILVQVSMEVEDDDTTRRDGVYWQS